MKNNTIKSLLLLFVILLFGACGGEPTVEQNATSQTTNGSKYNNEQSNSDLKPKDYTLTTEEINWFKANREMLELNIKFLKGSHENIEDFMNAVNNLGWQIPSYIAKFNTNNITNVFCNKETPSVESCKFDETKFHNVVFYYLNYVVFLNRGLFYAGTPEEIAKFNAHKDKMINFKTHGTNIDLATRFGIKIENGKYTISFTKADFIAWTPQIVEIVNALKTDVTNSLTEREKLLASLPPTETP